MIARVSPALRREILQVDGNGFGACINCGNCTAICPLSREAMQFPRIVLRHAHLGLEDKLMESLRPIYSCLLCRLCEESCPTGVPIAEQVRVTRNFLNRRVYKVAKG